MLSLLFRYKSDRNWSNPLASTLDFGIFSSVWSEEDSLMNVNTGIIKCVIPVRAQSPQLSAFLDVFAADVWLAIAVSIMSVSFLVTFPDPKAALQLMISLGLSCLTAFEVSVPRRVIRRSSSRFQMLLVTYFVLQMVLINIYKNDMTSAFSQVESSREIREMMHSSGARDGRKRKHYTRPFFAQRPEQIRGRFFSQLSETMPYCDVDESSLLRRFNLPVATYSKAIVFSSITSYSFLNPLLPPESLFTLQKYGLITLKSSALSKGDVHDHKIKGARILAAWEPETENRFETFNPHKKLLTEKYGAALELRDGAVFCLDKMQLLFHALSIVMIFPFIAVIVERGD